MRDSENTHQHKSASCNCSGSLCKLGLTSLHDFDGLCHLYICRSLFSYSTFLGLHSCF